MSHSADTVYTVMNRLLAGGREVRWLTEAVEGGRVGDVYVPGEGLAPEEMTALSTELRLPIRALGTAPAVPHLEVRPARIGLFKPWVASMDEGWTRFLLERYEFPHVNLANADVADGSFARHVDVLLLPDVARSIIESGEPDEAEREFWTPLPPEYAGGVGPEGGEAIAKWVREGGTAVALDSSTEYLIALFGLPIENVLAEVTSETFDCPGSMLRLLIDTGHPLGYGLRPEEAGYFATSPAFKTALPDPRFDRHVVARYPDHRDDILVSGYLKGAELLARRAAVVEYRIGKGKVVLIGFRAQHRAQPHRTFKLLFNALYNLGES